MKKTVTIAVLCLITLATAQARSIQDLFDKYADDERFTYVSVGRGAMNMVSGFIDFATIPSEDKEMISKINGVKILTLESATDEKLMKTIVTEVDKVVKDGQFESLAEVRDKGERVNVYMQTSKNTAELLIAVKNKKEMSLIWFSGTKDAIEKQVEKYR